MLIEIFFNSRFTYQESFKSFLNETDCFAGQREIIAENIQENVLNKMQKLGSDSRADRKKVFYLFVYLLVFFFLLFFLHYYDVIINI